MPRKKESSPHQLQEKKKITRISSSSRKTQRRRKSVWKRYFAQQIFRPPFPKIPKFNETELLSAPAGGPIATRTRNSKTMPSNLYTSANVARQGRGKKIEFSNVDITEELKKQKDVVQHINSKLSKLDYISDGIEEILKISKEKENYVYGEQNDTDSCSKRNYYKDQQFVITCEQLISKIDLIIRADDPDSNKIKNIHKILRIHSRMRSENFDDDFDESDDDNKIDSTFSHSNDRIYNKYHKSDEDDDDDNETNADIFTAEETTHISYEQSKNQGMNKINSKLDYIIEQRKIDSYKIEEILKTMKLALANVVQMREVDLDNESKSYVADFPEEQTSNGNVRDGCQTAQSSDIQLLNKDQFPSKFNQYRVQERKKLGKSRILDLSNSYVKQTPEQQGTRIKQNPNQGNRKHNESTPGRVISSFTIPASCSSCYSFDVRPEDQRNAEDDPQEEQNNLYPPHTIRIEEPVDGNRFSNFGNYPSNIHINRHNNNSSPYNEESSNSQIAIHQNEYSNENEYNLNIMNDPNYLQHVQPLPPPPPIMRVQRVTTREIIEEVMQ